MRKTWNRYWEYSIAIIILIIAVTQFEYARDYTSGRLEYLWNFAELSNKDVRLFTFIIIVGAGIGALIHQVYQLIKNGSTAAIKLTKEERDRVLKFGISGGIGLVWKTILLVALVEIFNVSEVLAVIPIFFLISLHNYILNSIWTFKGFKPGRYGYFRYLLVNAATGVVYFSIYYSFLYIDTYYLYASFLGVGAAGLLNFAASRYGIWKPI